MTRPAPLPALMAYEQKIRLAVQVLLSADEGELPDGLLSELVAFRDKLDLIELRNVYYAVNNAPNVPELVADMLRKQIRNGVLQREMTLSAASVARAYSVDDADAVKALDILAGEDLLACGEHPEFPATWSPRDRTRPRGTRQPRLPSPESSRER